MITRTEPLLAIIEKDYAATRELMESALGSAGRTRTFGLALVGVLIGATLSSHLPLLGAATALIASLVALVDAFYSWQYERALGHARRIERIQQHLYRAYLRDPDNAHELRRLGSRLRSFRPGSASTLHRFRLRDAWYSSPPVVFRGLYPAVIIGAAVAAVVAGGPPDPTRVTIDRPLSIEPVGWENTCPVGSLSQFRAGRTQLRLEPDSLQRQGILRFHRVSGSPQWPWVASVAWTIGGRPMTGKLSIHAFSFSDRVGLSIGQMHATSIETPITARPASGTTRLAAQLYATKLGCFIVGVAGPGISRTLVFRGYF
jgi:hypothetical protein